MKNILKSALKGIVSTVVLITPGIIGVLTLDYFMSDVEPVVITLLKALSQMT